MPVVLEKDRVQRQDAHPEQVHARSLGGLDHDQIELLQMQPIVGRDQNFCAISPFEFLDARLLLFLQEQSNGRMRADNHAQLLLYQLEGF